MDPQSQPVAQTERSARLWAVGLVILVTVLVLLGATYYYLPMTQQSPDSYPQQLDKVHLAHHAGDHTASIQEGEKALALAPDKTSEAHILAMLAFDYVLRNGPGDRQKGMQLYVETIADETYPKEMRALILNDLATLMMSADRETFESLLSVEPYNGFLPTTAGRFDVVRAVLAMYKMSDDMYPNAFAKLGIVNIYGLLLTSGGLTANEDSEVIAGMMQDYVRQAEPLLTRDSYEPSNVARMYLYRAMGLGVSNRILDNISFEDRERAYQQAVAFAAQAENDYQLRSVLLQSRFFYAGFLQEYGGADRLAEVRSILLPFGDAAQHLERYQPIQGFFETVLGRPSTDLTRKRIDILKEISPEFSAYIDAIS